MRTLGILVSSIALTSAGCASPPARDASSLSVEQNHGWLAPPRSYAVYDAKGNPVTERELARLYQARTGSTELLVHDHRHLVDGGFWSAVAVAGFGAMAGLTVVAHSDCVRPDDHDSNACTGGVLAAAAAGVVGGLAAGIVAYIVFSDDPGYYELGRPELEDWVKKYNAAGSGVRF